jgi:hypothetical protein
MFGPKREEVIAGWKKKLNSEKLHQFVISLNFIRVINRYGPACSTHRGYEKCVEISSLTTWSEVSLWRMLRRCRYHRLYRVEWQDDW